MLKLVSWIDSLPRLAHRRKNGNGLEQPQQQPKRRFEKIKAKSTTSTPLIKHRIDEKSKKSKRSTQEKSIENRPPAPINSAIRAIGRRRYTEPDAFQRTNSPVRALSPASILSPRVYVSSPMDEEDDAHRLMSMSWHPEGIERVHSLKIEMTRSLIAAHPISCSVQEIGIDNENGSTITLQSQMHLAASRPQIRTNPWVRPKSPRVIPALDLSRTGSLSIRKKQQQHETTTTQAPRAAKSGSQLLVEPSGKKDDSSVYSLRSSSGYGSGASQDSSPASSVHTPDWQTLSVSRYGSTSLRSTTNSNTNLRLSAVSKSREDVALQCDLTEDKSVECTEEDFLPFLERDENGNIPMIDDDDETDGSECSEDEDDGHVCDGHCPAAGQSDSDMEQSGHVTAYNTPKPNAVLNLLHAKVQLLKVNSDQVSQAVRTAKEEQRKRNGELRVYEEQMQFLKQLKLAISNGFEVMV